MIMNRFPFRNFMVPSFSFKCEKYGPIIFSQKIRILEPIIALFPIPYSDSNAYNYCHSQNAKNWYPIFHFL
jgi:hypothetical protein